MPPALKRALVREVARRESNLNDVAVALLADRFGISFSPSGRRRKAIAGAAGAVVLRMPPELRRELKAAARRRKLNVNDLVLLTLADAFEVPLQFLMNPAHHHRHAIEWAGARREWFSIPYMDGSNERCIWGATAAMLRNFYRFLAA